MLLQPLTFLPLAAQTSYRQWAVLAILFLIALTFSVSNVILSSVIGPKRKGLIKDAPYESGVEPAGNPHQRFNVRFYLIAMIFLVFDVEVLFFIPWVTIFPNYETLKIFAHGAPATLTLWTLFTAVIAFTAIVLIAYIYAWAKGVLRWD